MAAVDGGEQTQTCPHGAHSVDRKNMNEGVPERLRAFLRIAQSPGATHQTWCSRAMALEMSSKSWLPLAVWTLPHHQQILQPFGFSFSLVKGIVVRLTEITHKELKVGY